MRNLIVRIILILSLISSGYLMFTNAYKFYRNSIYNLYDGSISYLIGICIGFIIFIVGILLSLLIKIKGEK